jgi:hypothetical protein
MDAQSTFETLDGRDLFVSHRHWRVEVFSVSDHADHRWVQVGLHGSGDYMLTLRLPAGAGPQSAVSALWSWLQGPIERRPSQILNVA